MIKAARIGRVTARSLKARAKQAEKQRRHAAEVKSMESSRQARLVDRDSVSRKDPAPLEKGHGPCSGISFRAIAALCGGYSSREKFAAPEALADIVKARWRVE